MLSNGETTQHLHNRRVVRSLRRTAARAACSACGCGARASTRRRRTSRGSCSRASSPTRSRSITQHITSPALMHPLRLARGPSHNSLRHLLSRILSDSLEVSPVAPRAWSSVVRRSVTPAFASSRRTAGGAGARARLLSASRSRASRKTDASRKRKRLNGACVRSGVEVRLRHRRMISSAPPNLALEFRSPTTTPLDREVRSRRRGLPSVGGRRRGGWFGRQAPSRSWLGWPRAASVARPAVGLRVIVSSCCVVSPTPPP